MVGTSLRVYITEEVFLARPPRNFNPLPPSPPHASVPPSWGGIWGGGMEEDGRFRPIFYYQNHHPLLVSVLLLEPIFVFREDSCSYSPSFVASFSESSSSFFVFFSSSFFASFAFCSFRYPPDVTTRWCRIYF